MLFIHKSTTKRASDINFLSPSFVHFVWFNPPRFLSDDAFAVLLMTCRARAVRLRVGAFQRIQTTPKSRWKLSKIRKQLPFQSLFVFRLWLGESIKTNEWEAAGWVCSWVLSMSKSCLRKLLTKYWSRPQVCFHEIPIWSFIMLPSSSLSYILLGASLFKAWENWDYLDGSYFCFISLSSIGFGDLVPGATVSLVLAHAFQLEKMFSPRCFYDALQSFQQLIRRNKNSLNKIAR